MRARLARLYRVVACGDPVLGAGMAALFLYYVVTHGIFQGKASGDGWFGFLYLRAIFFEHTLDMQKVIPQYLPYFSTGGPHHAMPNRCPFGPVLPWTPFYLVGCALMWIGHALHLAPAPRGDEPFLAWWAGLATLAAVLWGYRSLFLLFARRLGTTAARLGATAAIWATPMAWYAVTQPAYQHGLAFGFVAALVERWDATLGKPDERRFVLLGILGGLAMEMRAQEALFLLLPGLEALWHVARGPERRRWLVGGVALCAATVVAFAPQVLVWRYYTGTLAPPQVEPLRWSTPFVVVALFSTRGGLYAWSPIAYVSTVGVALACLGTPRARAARLLTAALGALFAVEVYVVASAWVVTSGFAYGARRLSDGAVVLGLGVAVAFAAAELRPRWRRFVVGFTAFSVALNLFAMELMRARAVASSGGYARTASHWLEEANSPIANWARARNTGPRAAVRAVDDAALGGAQAVLHHVGYPFVQPAGWLFALYHHAPADAFEGVVGNFLLDRDGQWFTVLSKQLNFDLFNRASVVEGLTLHVDADKQPAEVTGRVRLLLSMFAKEPVSVALLGELPPGPAAVVWAGRTLEPTRVKGGLQFDVPRELVDAGVNEVALELHAGSRLRRLEFTSLSRWWK